MATISKILQSYSPYLRTMALFAFFLHTTAAFCEEIYQIQPGDTLSEIAQRYKVAKKIYGPSGGVAILLSLNRHIKDENLIRIGDTLRMPATPPTQISQEVVSRPEASVASSAPMPVSLPTYRPTLRRMASLGSHRLVRPRSLPGKTGGRYWLGAGFSQATLSADFADAAAANAVWQTEPSINSSFKGLARLTSDWGLLLEMRMQQVAYASSSNRLRGKRASVSDFGLIGLRRLSMGDVGVGVWQATINPVFPLVDGRYQLVSLHGTFVTFDLHSQVRIASSSHFIPKVRFAPLLYGQGYDTSVTSGL